MIDEYHMAQKALAEMKTAVLGILLKAPGDGLSNADIGRALGIYHGHQGHQGHISRTILAMLEDDGVAEQNDETKKWYAISP